MRMALLAGGEGWHVRDLQRAATLRQHQTELFDFRRLTSQERFSDHDVIVVRTMPPGSLEQVVFRMDSLLTLEASGFPIFNPPRSLELCIDKYLSTARLSAADLPVPETIVCQDSESALEAFDSLGGDVVVKPLFGSEGRGLIRVTDFEMAWRAFRALERVQSVIYLQRFVPHHGYDLRLFVLGDRVLTAMRRCSEDWRTNVAQGAIGEWIDPTIEERNLALKAAQTLNVPIAGVDLLPGLDGVTYVLEANAVPGWRKLTKVTGVDVAVEIVRFIEERA